MWHCPIQPKGWLTLSGHYLVSLNYHCQVPFRTVPNCMFKPPSCLQAGAAWALAVAWSVPGFVARGVNRRICRQDWVMLATQVSDVSPFKLQLCYFWLFFTLKKWSLFYQSCIMGLWTTFKAQHAATSKHYSRYEIFWYWSTAWQFFDTLHQHKSKSVTARSDVFVHASAENLYYKPRRAFFSEDMKCEKNSENIVSIPRISAFLDCCWLFYGYKPLCWQDVRHTCVRFAGVTPIVFCGCSVFSVYGCVLYLRKMFVLALCDSQHAVVLDNNPCTYGHLRHADAST